MNSVNIIVFSITSSFFNLENTIKSFNNNKDILIITPHIPLDWEKSKILSATNSKVIFKSFYEFITEDEMKFCDTNADKKIIQKYKKRNLRLNKYFDEIKKLKNQIIISNIKKVYNFDEKWILAQDLGIHHETWIKNGFRLSILTNSKKLNLVSLAYKKLKSLIKLFKNNSLHYLIFNNNKFYFYGKKNRVAQYIDNKKVKFSKISSGKYILFILLLIFYKNNIFPSLISSLSIKIFCKKKTLNNQHIFSTLHSYSDDLVYISKIFNLEIVCLQDGLLPSNFTSSYYKYLDKIKLFYVWDNISTKIFSKNDLQYDIWSGFKKKKLPKINHSLKIKIRNILFLTSGSGDWTALKNRSDEDLAYLALKKIAKLFPAIKFVYRPHPLWINPAHQGINSIERLIIDSKKDKVLNFEISDNSLKEASNFQKENNENVSFISKSIEDEIKSADIVLGDHSEALLNAAQQEKIIGSVSLARRKEFFYDYTFLGFPLMRSVDDIAKFIDQVENDTNFCTSYNKIIEKFNQLDN